MKKKMFRLLSACMCFALLAACGTTNQPSGSNPGSGSATSPSSGDREVFELTLGHIQNPGHDLYIAIDDFAKTMEERSEGRIKITVYPSSQLGTEREMIEQCLMGTLDIAASDPSGWASGLNMPELAVFGLPFLYSDLEDQKILIEEVALDEYQLRMTPAGAHPFMIYSNGIRNTILKEKPIVVMEDLSGVKMRCPEAPMYVNTWKNLGCTTVTIPWGEVYTGLSQGVADAAEADAVGLVNTNLQEVGNYYSRTAHMGGIWILSINEDKWNSLPADLQEVFIEVASENTAKQIENRANSDAVAEQALLDAGVMINDVSQEERARMREAVQPLYDEYIESYNMGDLLDRISALIG